MASILTAHSIAKSFTVGRQTIPVLKDVSLAIEANDFMVITGPSGCGKSTLLHILLGLEEPTGGRISAGDADIYTDFNEDGRAEWRKQHVGMIFQKPNWIQALNVVDNVMFPLTLLDMDKVEAVTKANQALDRVGMVEWAHHSPNELSSGQQQKVSLARAIITDPELLVADEPTGNLDFESGQQLMELLTRLNQQGKTVIMVSHDLEYMRYAKTAVRIFNGQIVEIEQGDKVKTMIDQMQSSRHHQEATRG